MRRITLVLSTLVLGSFAVVGGMSDALASGAPNWTGPYAGLNVGYGYGNAPTSVTINPAESTVVTSSNAPAPTKSELDGFMGGGQVGYNYQFEKSFVAGLETDFDYSGASRSNSAVGAPYIGGTMQTTVKERLGGLGTLRGRLGGLPMDNLLLYGTGGLAYGSVTTNLIGNNLTGCGGFVYCMSGSSSGISVGWTAGLGAEYAFMDKWSLKAEYLHIDLGSNSATTGFDPANAGGNATAKNSFTTDAIKVGLNYHF
ncbi:MAG: outer membrane beta-barrel protein [Alphaproteobacteria bacterium]